MAELNVYQKLIKARKMFLDAAIKKSGKNFSMSYTYYELADIVPMATKIFDELGLVSVVNCTSTDAVMTIYNTDKPAESVVFSAPADYTPITNKSGNQVIPTIQQIGSSLTYLRRYLYLAALDIVEADTIDNDKPVAPAPVENKTAGTNESPIVVDGAGTNLVAASPIIATAEKRAEIKKELTSVDSPADSMQTNAITIACQKYLEITGKSAEAKKFVGEIVKETDNLKKLTKKKAEEIIVELDKRVKEIADKTVNEFADDLPF